MHTYTTYIMHIATHAHVHTQYTCVWVHMDTCIHRIHCMCTHTYGHLQKSSLAFHCLHSNLLGVCVTLRMLYNLCLSFLISTIRSVVIFMTWDCGQDEMKNSRNKPSTGPRTSSVLKSTSSDFRCSSGRLLGPTLCGIPTVPGLPTGAGLGPSACGSPD